MKFNELTILAGINDWKAICLDIDQGLFEAECRVSNGRICVTLTNIETGKKGVIESDLYFNLNSYGELEQHIIENLDKVIWS